LANDVEWIAVARLGRTRGLKGELFAQGLSSRPERYGQLRQVYLFDRDGKPLKQGAPLEVESVRWIQDRLVFKFAGVDSVSDAEPLAGAEVRIAAQDRPALPDGEYYESEIAGCEVIDGAAGQPLGIVQRWLEFGGPPLLEVKPNDGGEAILIPFVKSICREIDPANRRIVVELPEGLKDLNRR